MTDDDLTDLLRLAEAAKSENSVRSHLRFNEAASPDVVARLVERVKAAEAAWGAERDRLMDLADERVDENANLLAQEDGLQSMVNSLRAERDAAEARCRDLEGLLRGLKEAHRVTARERDAAVAREQALRDRVRELAIQIGKEVTSAGTERDRALFDAAEALRSLLSPPTADTRPDRVRIFEDNAALLATADTEESDR